jgi:hypothetical protein
MTPQELTDKLDDAKRGPSLVKPPREIGNLREDYRPQPKLNRLATVKHHMRNLTEAEWSQMAREVRGNLRIRLCNDEVINALLRAWALD